MHNVHKIPRLEKPVTPYKIKNPSPISTGENGSVLIYVTMFNIIKIATIKVLNVIIEYINLISFQILLLYPNKLSHGSGKCIHGHLLPNPTIPLFHPHNHHPQINQRVFGHHPHMIIGISGRN